MEQGYLEILDRVFASGEAYAANGAKYIVHADAEGTRAERFVDFVCQPIKGADGKVSAIFVEGADITERAKADAALRESETRLRALAEELRSTNRLKDEFLATLAHELRNPLAPIRNALEILKLGANDKPSAAKARAMMERQLAQLIRLIDDLMDLSRVNRGIVELRRSPIALRHALREAVETGRVPI